MREIPLRSLATATRFTAIQDENHTDQEGADDEPQREHDVKVQAIIVFMQ